MGIILIQFYNLNYINILLPSFFKNSSVLILLIQTSFFINFSFSPLFCKQVPTAFQRTFASIQKSILFFHQAKIMFTCIRIIGKHSIWFRKAQSFLCPKYIIINLHTFKIYVIISFNCILFSLFPFHTPEPSLSQESYLPFNSLLTFSAESTQTL